jgi:hypothetical protein
MLMSMPSERGTDQEDRRHGEEKRDAAAKRHLEQELAHQNRQGDVEHADREVGQQFAEDQLVAPDRRRDELLHGPLLPLAGDRERGEQGRDHHHDHGDQAGDDVIARLEIGVEPGAGPEIDGRVHDLTGGPTDLAQRHVLGVAEGDHVDIAHGDGRGVRVAAVDDCLDRRRSPGLDPASKIGRDHERDERTAGVDRPLDLAVAAHVLDDREVPGALEPADELAALVRSALVPDDRGDVVHVKRQRVAEQDQEQHGDGDRHAEAARIAQDVDGLLAGDGPDTKRLHRPTPPGADTGGSCGHAWTSSTRSRARSRASIRDTNASSREGVIVSIRSIR